MTDNRINNSQECIYFGRKLSNIVPEIEVTDIPIKWDICIGSVRDDEIYFPPVLKDGEEMLRERVKIFLEVDTQNDEIHTCDIDLEDVLRFAAKNCRGIYDRVLSEVVK